VLAFAGMLLTPVFARCWRVRRAIPTRLPDCRPLPLPCGNWKGKNAGPLQQASLGETDRIAAGDNDVIQNSNIDERKGFLKLFGDFDIGL
jgi:hypothetical protein